MVWCPHVELRVSWPGCICQVQQQGPRSSQAPSCHREHRAVAQSSFVSAYHKPCMCMAQGFRDRQDSSSFLHYHQQQQAGYSNRDGYSNHDAFTMQLLGSC